MFHHCSSRQEDSAVPEPHRVRRHLRELPHALAEYPGLAALGSFSTVVIAVISALVLVASQTGG